MSHMWRYLRYLLIYIDAVGEIIFLVRLLVRQPVTGFHTQPKTETSITVGKNFLAEGLELICQCSLRIRPPPLLLHFEHNWTILLIFSDSSERRYIKMNVGSTKRRLSEWRGCKENDGIRSSLSLSLYAIRPRGHSRQVYFVHIRVAEWRPTDNHLDYWM